MIYDDPDQKQMLDRAAFHIMRKLDLDDDRLPDCEEAAQAAFHYAFFAIDREALIEKCFQEARISMGNSGRSIGVSKAHAEAVLVATGIIPERAQEELR